MTLFSWMEERIHRFGIWDFAVLKTALVIVGMMIGAYIPAFVKDNLTIFIVVFVLLYAHLLFRIFRK